MSTDPAHTRAPSVLIVGLRREVLQRTADQVQAAVPNATTEIATTVEEVAELLTHHHVDHVVTGSALDLNTRLRLVRTVFDASDSTNVHLKEWTSGPDGLLAFAIAALQHPGPAAKPPAHR